VQLNAFASKAATQWSWTLL